VGDHITLLLTTSSSLCQYDRSGNFLSSAGKMGFRVLRKHSYAAQLAAQDCAKVAHDAGLRKVKVFVKGPGAGRDRLSVHWLAQGSK